MIGGEHDVATNSTSGNQALLGIARVVEHGLYAAVGVTSAIAFLGVLIFDMDILFGLLILPVCALLSGASVAFVLLKHDERSGAITALASLALIAVGSIVLLDQTVGVVLFYVGCWLGAYCIALVLKRTVSLAYAVLAAVPVALIVVWFVTASKDKLVGYMQASMLSSINALPAEQQARLEEVQLELMLEGLPSMLADTLNVWVLFISLCAVFIARHWQACMVNVGGFQKEFHSLKLGREAGLVYVAMSVLAWLTGNALLIAVSTVFMFLFFIQGLSVVHCLTKQRGLSSGWLSGMYILLMLPPTVLFLSALGLADNFFRLRTV